MSLATRQPTGQVAWPMILLEGAEKVGKTYTALRLSDSPRVGRTFVFDLGEGTADEYAQLGPYEIVDHDGTFVGFLDQLKAACAEPTDPDVPNVVVIDSATVLWETIKDWAGQRARKGKKARALLRDDPDADVSIPMNIWTDAADRWGQMIHTLRYAPVVSVLIARGKEVAMVGRDGQPVMGKTDYKIEVHKSTASQATALVRVDGPGKVRLMGVRSLSVQVPASGLALPEVDPLHHLVFDVMGAGATFAPSSAPAMTGTERTVAWAKSTLLELCDGDKGRAAQIWQTVDPSGPRVSDEEWTALVDAIAAPEPEGASA